MQQQQLEKFKAWFDNYVAGFYSDDEFINANIERKLQHTRRTCREMLYIAGELGLSDDDKCIAELIALFHDIGRFEQFAKYQTYNDARSVSHCELGVQVLGRTDVLRQLIPAEREVIETAIKYHGVKKLPENLNGRCLLFCRLIRDADKIDALYTVTEYYKQYKEKPEQHTLELDFPDEPKCSDEVVQAVLRGQSVDYNRLQTTNDFRLCLLAWVYDVNFPVTLKAIKQRQLLQKLLEFLPETEDIRKVKQKILDYVDSRLRLNEPDPKMSNLTKEGVIMKEVLQTKIKGYEPKRGKVRDIYDLGDKLLIAATDRISAFDVVMDSGIPHKGFVLTQLTLFWFDFLADYVEHHLVSAEFDDLPEPFRKYREQLAGRIMLVRKTEVLPIECVVRGYLAGSGWVEYKKSGTVCGQKLPRGLKQCEKLPELIFTPATKAERGTHDENISFEQSAKIIGKQRAQYVRDKSMEIFHKASTYAESKGIILADTKFEWGVIDGRIILIDEVLTPDSSRFWPADKYESGRDQESFDKQFVRNYLESINFDKSGPGVKLPDDIRQKTSQKYIEAYERLTGKKFKGQVFGSTNY